MAKPRKRSAKKVPKPKKVGKSASKSEGKKDPATPEPPADTFAQTPPPWASKEG